MIQRLTLIALVIVLSMPSIAQKEFSKLPAKVKLKMAQEEEIASDADPVFQGLMTEGMNFFEAKEYELAIEKFEEAGTKRPINVYPPVMIEDVKLAMTLPQEEETVIEEEPEVIEEPKATEPQMTAEERVEKMYQEELAKVYAELPKDPPPVKKQPKVEEPVAVKSSTEKEGLVLRDKEEIIADGGVLIEEAKPKEEITKPVVETTKPVIEESKPVVETTKPTIVKETPKEPVTTEENKPLAEVQEELAAAYPDGVTEEVFTEGNRTITKRVVVKNGSGDEYRKVKHGWGGVFYFKNGTSITERVWKAETE
jgi:hypothetical protein